MRYLMAVLCLIVGVPPALGASKTETWTSEPRVWAELKDLPPASDPQYWFDATDASLARSRALDVLERTAGRCADEDVSTKRKTLRPCNVSERPTFPAADDYVIIHVLRWKTPAAGSSALEIDKQHWYVVTDQAEGDDQSYAGNRLMGTRRVVLLYLHLNRPAGPLYVQTYALTTTKKMAAWLNHLVGVGQLFGVGAPAGGLGDGTKEIAVWNANTFDIEYVPSDITIRGRVDPRVAAVPAVTIEPKTFDNEGKYRVDFTVGVPIRKFTDLQYANANGQLVPVKIDKSAIFALFNYHLKPVDIKEQNFSWVPHAVAGVAIQDRPLKKVLIGAGFGPLLAQAYVGVLLNTHAVPTGWSCGDALPAQAEATANKTCPEFAFGLNLSVGSVIEALKKKADPSKDAKGK